ncbi:hypothetical protein BN946_scf184999.g4 [Trametes cinnabarina]|uniref:F-box domain-containing protein n=1 Tax=Pycnoporus cinnabarinus TaxID=5643 RepID=A0A060SDM9_PYCCI|nr:hypothetical protein BN946_scf184999.g4 [Trametes cinnabarina]
MNTVNLPFDVLHAIISSLDDKGTALAVSLTCRTLRGLAIRRLLSILPINLKDQETVHALHKFLFANESARIQSLRKLNISIRSVDKPYSAEETVQCLVDILKHATRLEWLALCTFADDGLFDDFPQVLDAICELSSLWELVVDGDWSSPVQTILRRVRSPLKVLHIRPNGIHLPEQTFWIDPSHHESLLSQRLAFSLEELHMEGAALWYPLGYKGVQFPGVRSVFLGYHGGPQRMETFLHMFPALNGTFDTGDLEFDEGALLKANMAEQRRVRALNKQSQEIRTWKYLDRVIGDTHALYMLALACSVRHLVVKQVCGHRKEQVADILRDTQPTCLNILIRLSHGLRIFEDLFPPEATPVLTHLVLVVFYENFDTHVGNLNPCCHGDAHEIQWIALLVRHRRCIPVLMFFQ